MSLSEHLVLELCCALSFSRERVINRDIEVGHDAYIGMRNIISSYSRGKKFSIAHLDPNATDSPSIGVLRVIALVNVVAVIPKCFRASVIDSQLLKIDPSGL